jgi:hypothetical protein
MLCCSWLLVLFLWTSPSFPFLSPLSWESNNREYDIHDVRVTPNNIFPLQINNSCTEVCRTCGPWYEPSTEAKLGYCHNAVHHNNRFSCQQATVSQSKGFYIFTMFLILLSQY